MTFDPELRNKFKIFPMLGVHSMTFNPELRNEFNFISILGGSIPQFWILNSEMNLKFFSVVGGPFHNF